MFEELPDSAARAQMTDAQLDAAISGWTALLATASAHRLLFIGEKTTRNYDDNWDTTEDTDSAWNSAAAEISVASGISHGRASGDMEIGMALSARLPTIAALLLAGTISERLARRIVHRTANILDPDLLAQVEAEIADRATHWGTLSQKKLDAAIDLLVHQFDPGALRRTRVRVRDRSVDMLDTEDGVTEILLRLKGADAALYWRRLTVMAQGVCAKDPRTLHQRRADANGALGAGYFHLACECGTPECPAATEDDGRGSHVVVYIYAENTTLNAEPDPLMDGDGPLPDDGTPPAPDNVTIVHTRRTRDTTVDTDHAADAEGEPMRDDDGSQSGDDIPQPGDRPRSPDPGASERGGDGECADTVVPDKDSDHAVVAESENVAAEQVAAAEQDRGEDPAEDHEGDANKAADEQNSALLRPPPGIIVGVGAVPAALVAERIATGAKVRHLTPPRIEPEPQYSPKISLAEWVRARDLTCRFANCDRPAEFCDFDHTVPWPAGATHASGAKMVCRQHHRGKTFWAGWSDVQHPDGTIVWTTPTGRRYTTKPGSSLFFPTVNTTSAPITTGPPTPNSPDKITKMPGRQRNRAKERAYRINAERALNANLVAEWNNPLPF